MCCRAQRIYGDVVFEAFVVILQMIFEAFSSPRTAERLADFQDFAAGDESAPRRPPAIIFPLHYFLTVNLF